MQRIVDRLNDRTPTRCDDAPDGWRLEVIADHPDQRPALWVTFHHQDIEAMVLVWDRRPNWLDLWHARIIAALRGEDGTPEISITRHAGSEQRRT